VVALQGSSCWGNGCSDAAYPKASDLPSTTAATLDAIFPLLGNWAVSISDKAEVEGCVNYPVQVTGDGAGHLRFTPSGPPGKRVATYGVYAGDGDTSGWWRWTVPPRDGVPLAWVHLNQNGPSTGGMAELALIVDDAAVDGDVDAELTVESADGAVATFALSDVDQRCHGDGFVALSARTRTPQGKIDHLGPPPSTYRVSMTIDGLPYTGRGTWTGVGTEHGGDADISFDPSLPRLK